MDYHQDRFDDYSLLVFNKKELLAVLPANKVGSTLYSHQGLTYGGLVLAKSLGFKDVLSCFEAILMFLNAQKIEVLELKLLPAIYHLQPSEEVNYLLFKTNAELKRTDVLSVIDCNNVLDIVSNNRKRGLKRSQKNELIVREVNECGAFWNEILIPNLKKRHGVPPVHTLGEISNLKQHFPDNIRQFNVYKNDEIVAGATIFETEKVAHVQYISANELKQQYGSLDILFSTLINSVFKEKPFFDFGISNENNGQQINNGLIEWKESFGARSITQSFYAIETKSYVKLKDILI